MAKKDKRPTLDQKDNIQLVPSTINYEDGTDLDVNQMDANIIEYPVPSGTICETDTVENWFEQNEELVMSSARGFLIIVKFCNDHKIPAPCEADLWLLDPHKDVFNICTRLYKENSI